MNSVNAKLDLLLVEDKANDATLIERELKKFGLDFVSTRVDSESSYRQALLDRPDVILCDYNMPGFGGLHALEIMLAEPEPTPFILISGAMPDERAVRAMQMGADDYLMKDRLARLGNAICRAVETHRARRAEASFRQDLADREAFYRQLIEALPTAIYITDSEGRITFHNNAAVELWGRAPDPEKDRWSGAFKIFDADGNAMSLAEGPMASTVRDGREAARGHHIVVERPDRSRRFVQAHPHVLYDADGNISGGVNLMTDVTELRTNQLKILRLNQVHSMHSKLHETIQHVTEPKKLLDETCRVGVETGGFGIAWAGKLDRNTGLIEPVAVHSTDGGPDLDKFRISTLSKHKSGGGICSQAILQRKVMVTGNLRQVPFDNRDLRERVENRGYHSAIALPLFVDGQAWGVIVFWAREKDFFVPEEVALLSNVAADLSYCIDNLEKSETINYLASYDSLTGVPNRRLLLDRMTELCTSLGRQGINIALILIDIEQFQAINELIGRERADDLLRDVARQLDQSIFDRDIVARLGNNTFAIFMHGFREPKQVLQIVEDRIFQQLEQPIDMGGKQIKLKANAGIALFPNDGDNPETLILNAEATLKKVKSSSQRCLFYAPEMNAEVTEALVFENRLRLAIERDEFVLFYQPKVCTVSERIVGLEALIRWMDPEQGLLPPYRFIPFLEKFGLIEQVGKWVLQQAARQYQSWRTAGLEAPRIAVNVSAIQLQRDDFVPSVLAVCAEYNDPMLELEITESTIMENYATITDKLNQLRAINLDIAIDDFGTGYSSLQSLSRLPVTTLKIDRSFIQGLDNEADDMALVATIINLAHNMNLKVIAEGVETKEQMTLLRLLKCNEIQGYYYSKPVPVDEITVMLQEEAAGQQALPVRQAAARTG